MSRITFENYGLVAKNLDDFTSIGGRYLIQKEAEKKILLEIIHKLCIESKDKCLDIGCNAGNILIPLSFLVESITGIDHELCIQRLRNRFTDINNIDLISGNFLDLKLNESFDKIIVYGVVQCLKNRKEVNDFIDKAVSLLNPGGKVLFGDIPNESRKERFFNSSFGKNFQEEWNTKMATIAEKTNGSPDPLLGDNMPQDPELARFDDSFILSIIEKMRNRGYHAYVLPQFHELPFGFTREDILIEKLI